MAQLSLRRPMPCKNEHYFPHHERLPDADIDIYDSYLYSMFYELFGKYMKQKRNDVQGAAVPEQMNLMLAPNASSLT
eukprot:8506945-Heterocapsa_arctica.AAC.1